MCLVTANCASVPTTTPVVIAMSETSVPATFAKETNGVFFVAWKMEHHLGNVLFVL